MSWVFIKQLRLLWAIGQRCLRAPFSNISQTKYSQHVVSHFQTVSTSDFLVSGTLAHCELENPGQRSQFFWIWQLKKNVLEFRLFQTKVLKHATNKKLPGDTSEIKMNGSNCFATSTVYSSKVSALNCSPFRWKMHFRTDDHMEKHVCTDMDSIFDMFNRRKFRHQTSDYTENRRPRSVEKKRCDCADFLQKWNVEAQKRRFSARLPSKMKLKRRFSARLPSKMKLWC